MLNELNITRDCWWAMPSGDTYIVNEDNELSSHSTSFYPSFVSDDDKYLRSSDSGNFIYYGRLDSSNLDVSHVQATVRAELSPPGSAVLSINSLEIGTFNVSGVETQTETFELTDLQKEYVHNGRINANYDYFDVHVGTHSSGVPHIKLYEVDIAYSGSSDWDNHRTGLPNVATSTHYPSAATFRVGSVWDGAVTDIDLSPDDGGADAAYMTHTNPSNRGPFWTGSPPMPSGGISLHFGDVGDVLDPVTQITRARLRVRMALPTSGVYENAADAYEVNGYNDKYKNQDFKGELEYIEDSDPALENSYGYFLYGTNNSITNPGFTTYDTELNFLDPAQPSGNIASTRHANIDVLSNMEFQLVGVPSGAQISAAELQFEYIPNDTISLYTVGNAKRCAASSTVDAGTLDSYALGHGGWHHRGWKLYGPTVIEEEIFTNFYTFSESAGTRTYPETNKTYYFPDGDDDLTVYGDYVETVPEEGETLISLLKEPQRREYYRNPITSADLTPEYYTDPVDITLIQPTYYRHMIYHGASLDYLDLDLDDYEESELAVDDLCQVYFEDRIGLGTDFTLYFMLYRNYGFQTYGRFFHRGLLGRSIGKAFEVLGDLEQDRVRFTVLGANGGENRIETEIRRNTIEPILIWFSCGYEAEQSGMTTMSLNVHDDIANYFVNDWKRTVKHFSGYRREYKVTASGKTNVNTVLGTLEDITFHEQLSRRLYLHRVSPCEFGYSTDYIDIDHETSLPATQVGYDTSQDKDKYFMRSRIANSQYLQPNPSGVNWVVPQGSGAAEWATTYSIDDWSTGSLMHSLFNPVTTAGTDNIVAPSAIYIDLEAAHSTDHPSGVQVWVDVEFDSGTTDRWKVSHSEFTIPSGGGTYTAYQPIHYIEGIDKHINMDDGPILYTDVEKINVTVTTKYPNMGSTEYQGNLTLHSMNVFFDSYCVSATGIDSLDLYTYGGVNTISSDPDDGSTDLYVHGKTADTGSLDLYMYGYPHLSSGNLDLFLQSDVVTARMNLVVEGLDPPAASGDQDLFVWGTAEAGIRDKTTLFVESNLDPAWRLPLYLKADDGESTSSMNLFMGNYYPTASSGLPMYICGPSGANDSTNLYIKGYGVTDGYNWQNGDMNLYIDREVESTASNVTMFLANSKTTNNINLFMHGDVVANSSIPMYIYGSGVPSAIQELYTHGF